MAPIIGYVTVHASPDIMVQVAAANGGLGGMPAPGAAWPLSTPPKDDGGTAVSVWRLELDNKIDTYVYLTNRGGHGENVEVRWHGPSGGVLKRDRVSLNAAQSAWVAASGMLV